MHITRPLGANERVDVYRYNETGVKSVANAQGRLVRFFFRNLPGDRGQRAVNTPGLSFFVFSIQLQGAARGADLAVEGIGTRPAPEASRYCILSTQQ